jgi:predicted lipoprotein with Yx(FWY)xxD motif
MSLTPPLSALPPLEIGPAGLAEMRRALLVTVLAAALTAGLGASEAMAKKKGVKLKVKGSEYGKVLMNGGGKALYLFTKDKKGPSDCYGECARVWPPFLTKGKPVAGKGVKGKKLGTVRRDDGTRQVTYAGHPVYFYIHDSPGDILCQDVFEFGGRWLLLRGSGKAVR